MIPISQQHPPLITLIQNAFKILAHSSTSFNIISPFSSLRRYLALMDIRASAFQSPSSLSFDRPWRLISVQVPSTSWFPLPCLFIYITSPVAHHIQLQLLFCTVYLAWFQPTNLWCFACRDFFLGHFSVSCFYSLDCLFFRCSIPHYQVCLIVC